LFKRRIEKNMKKIVILGISCVDIVVADFEAIPDPGMLTISNNMSIHTGGCALNCAVDLAKIGINNVIISSVGKDIYGDLIKKTLIENNISLDNIVTQMNINTSTSVVLVDKNGERSFLHYPGANSVFDLAQIDLDVIKECDILFIGGALLMKKFDGIQMANVLKIAKSHGAKTVLDIGWDYSNRWMDSLEKSLPYVDIFVPSFDEAKILTRTSDFKEMAEFLYNKGIKELIIKLGKEGAMILKDGHPKIFPSICINNPADTTGAGDSFMAGIITGLALGWDMDYTIRFANAVGSLCVQSIGASTGILSLENIVKYLEENDNE